MSELQTAITNLQLKHSELVAAVKSYPGTVSGAANTAFGKASVVQRKARDTIRNLRNQIENDGQSLILDWEYDVAVVNGEGKLLSEEVEFSRSTGGGRFNAQGQYEWVEADVPRIDYDPMTGECRGLLVEEQRTNFAIKTGNEDPTIVKFQEESDGDNSFHAFAIDVSSGPADGGDYINRAIVRPVGRRYIGMTRRFSPSGNNWAMYDTDTDSFVRLGGMWPGGVWPKVTVLQNGWYEVMFGSASREDSNNGRFMLWVTSTPDAAAFVGEPGKGLEWLVVQRESGPVPTSYIPTEGAAVTRAKDFVTRDLGSEYNQSEGTLTVTAKANIGAVVARLGSLELIADTTDEKAYALSYTNGPASPVLELLPVGSGTITDVQYVPRATL